VVAGELRMNNHQLNGRLMVNGSSY